MNNVINQILSANSAHSLSTYTISRKLCHYILNLLKILETIPALVEAKAPVGRHVRTTYDLLVLLDHCLWLRTKKEVKIKNTWSQGITWVNGVHVNVCMHFMRACMTQ